MKGWTALTEIHLLNNVTSGQIDFSFAHGCLSRQVFTSSLYHMECFNDIIVEIGQGAGRKAPEEERQPSASKAYKNPPLFLGTVLRFLFNYG